MKIKFSFLTGDVNWLQYGGKWISPKLNNGEFNYWFVIELINMWDATGEEDQEKYNVSLHCVSPEQAGEENLNKAFECCGITEEEIKFHETVQVECLDSYGIHTVLKNLNGNNAYKLLKEIKREAQCAEFLFGFYMDRPVNKIGTTGWEAIKGDLNSGLARTISSGSTEGRILAKMHGINPDEIKG